MTALVGEFRILCGEQLEPEKSGDGSEPHWQKPDSLSLGFASRRGCGLKDDFGRQDASVEAG